MKTHYTKSLGDHPMDTAHRGSLLPPLAPPDPAMSAHPHPSDREAPGKATRRTRSEGDRDRERSAQTFRIETLAFVAALLVSAALGLYMGTLL